MSRSERQLWAVGLCSLFFSGFLIGLGFEMVLRFH